MFPFFLLIFLYFDLFSDPDDNPAPSEVRPVFADPAANVTEASLTDELKNNTLKLKDYEKKKLNDSAETGKNFMKYDQIINRRNSNEQESIESRIPPPVIDEEALKESNLEAHSFGFKVTVFKSPGSKGKFDKLFFLCHTLSYIIS